MAIKKSLILTFIVAIILLSFISQVSAQKFTGSIGNSRMVLKLGVGESVRKSILVKNVNETPITVNMTLSGELADNIELEEESFELSAGEEKKAYFTIKADEEGTTESKINVVFTPEGGNGVILSSTIIVIAGENTEADSEDSEDSTSSDDNSGWFNFGSSNSATEEAEEGTKASPVAILIISTLVLVAIFLALIIYSKRKSKKGLKEPRA